MKETQSILSRLFWFGVGGGLSVAINSTIFFIVRGRLGWPDWSALAVSLVVVTTVFAIWNYRINFRTERGWRECLHRYLAAIAICFAINYVVSLTGLKQFGSTRLGVVLVFLCVQTPVAAVKFLLYHRWVYPTHSPSTTSSV